MSVAADYRRSLAGHWRGWAVLLACSALEALPALLSGTFVRNAVDDGFAAGRLGVGVAWLLAFTAAAVLGAAGVRFVWRRIGVIVEPLRDSLVRRVVRDVLHETAPPRGGPDAAGVARVTQHVEIVRDATAGLLVQARGLLVTVAAALAGVAALDPLLLWPVAPPVLLAVLLFCGSLPALARSQRDLALADEHTATEAGAVLTGLRDVVACGAQDTAATTIRAAIDEQARAAIRMSTATALRTLIIGGGGLLPVVLVLAIAPAAVADGRLSAGTVLGALVYVTGTVQPALHGLATTTGSVLLRLMVALNRLGEISPGTGEHPGGTGDGGTGSGRGTSRNREDSGHRRTSSGWGSRNGRGARNDPSTRNDPGARNGPSTWNGSGARNDPGARNGPSTWNGSGARNDPGARNDSGTGNGRGAPNDSGAQNGRGARIPGGAGEFGGWDVEARGLTHRWGEHAEPVLRDLDLELRPGDHLAVVGPSGIGKSTLAGLLTGTTGPTGGSVHIGGIPVAELDPAHRHRLIAFTPQETYLFAGTVRENLALLAAEATDAHLLAAVTAVGAGELVRELGGLTGPIRHGGAGLSAGQRQLLALARLYASEARIVVLDEATAQLDGPAEAHAERAFAARGGVLVVIAHRLASARRANRVLVLDGDGAHLGTHADLLARSRSYAELLLAWTGVAGSS
ncbi:ABC transporter ATP-binding protein [Saccharopolyspora gloriosae]|uniref:ATP-binding cassette domain-containing protein n=1 Tax=Saccharopolyspora gloriosae TaxID=455344 RepID=UPI001FB69A1E|nr:ABC transporter ATP-binding protein [Saccharopolyspora gloriosae]